MTQEREILRCQVSRGREHEQVDRTHADPTHAMLAAARMQWDRAKAFVPSDEQIR